MYQSYFAPLRPTKFETLEEVETMLDERPEYESVLVSGDSISLLDKGVIKFGDREAQMSLEGFKQSMKKVYKIPDPFAARIPYHLLQENIKEIGKTLDYPLELLLNNDGLIINLFPAGMPRIPIRPLLSALEGQEPQHIQYSETGLTIQTLNPAVTFSTEPKVGDITRLGTNFSASETGFGFPIASTLAYTLICSNGAILPKRFGQIRMRIKSGEADPEAIARNLAYKLRNLIQSTESLGNRFNKMGQINLSFGRTYGILNSCSKVTDREEVLDHFKISGDEFTEIKQSAKNDEIRFDETEYGMYDFYSKVTNMANNHYGSERKRLQTIGGKFLEFEELGGKERLN